MSQKINKFHTALLLSYICIASMSAAIITPAFPVIQNEFSLTKGALSWLITIFMLGYVFGQLIYGPLANKYGRLNALRFGLLLNIVGLLICLIFSFGFFKSFDGLLFGRFITALGSSAGLVCTFILINEMYPAEEARGLMAYTVVSFTLGLAVSVTLGGLITEYMSWQITFIVLLIQGILMWLGTFKFSETLKISKPLIWHSILTQYKTAILNRKLLIFSLFLSFVSFMNYGYSAVAPLIAHNILLLSPAEYSYWNLLNMIGMLLSGVIGKVYIQKYGMIKVFAIGISGMSIVILMLIIFSLMQHKEAAFFFSTTTLGYFFTGLLFPCGAFYASTAIDDRASASAIMNFINMGGSMLVVALMGYLPFKVVYTYVSVFSIFFILATVLYIFLGYPLISNSWLKNKFEDRGEEI